jgi:uncharacterized membrane protein
MCGKYNSHATQRGSGVRIPDSEAASLSDHINQNIRSVIALRKEEWRAISPFQHRLESVRRFIARPLYLVGILTLSSLWMLFNGATTLLHRKAIDPPPFGWLELTLSFIALLTTTVVLISQNRQTKLEEQRADLDLQLSLLTEQKVTKVIDLLEELRRDLPMVKDRHDPQAVVLQERADTGQVVSALRDVASKDTAGGPGSEAPSSDVGSDPRDR